MSDKTYKDRHWWVNKTADGKATLYKDNVLCAHFEYPSDAKRVMRLLEMPVFLEAAIADARLHGGTLVHVELDRLQEWLGAQP